MNRTCRVVETKYPVDRFESWIKDGKTKSQMLREKWNRSSGSPWWIWGREDVYKPDEMSGSEMDSVRVCNQEFGYL